ncbi:MAG: hypothetical protein PHX77_05430 [Candidatus Bipolaricaulis sp.]|nr:hypothetical protein [Candidatus Bipolaricaulis sp.]MDD5645910.1 hypothetical protein [Candidatus Bipolaricaulis sp.]
MNKARWILLAVLAVLVVSVVVWAQTAPSAESSGSGSLWGATALGGVGGVAITQAIKKAVNKVFPNLLGKKATYSLAQIVSFGVGVVAYLLFPAGREQILSQGISIFQGGATATALSSTIYKLFGGLLGMKSTSA